MSRSSSEAELAGHCFVRNDYHVRSAVPVDGDRIVMVSYWPEGDFGDRGVFIRHTKHAHEAYISGCQQKYPSACVWIVPGTEG